MAPVVSVKMILKNHGSTPLNDSFCQAYEMLVDNKPGPLITNTDIAIE